MEGRLVEHVVFIAAPCFSNKETLLPERRGFYYGNDWHSHSRSGDTTWMGTTRSKDESLRWGKGTHFIFWTCSGSIWGPADNSQMPLEVNRAQGKAGFLAASGRIFKLLGARIGGCTCPLSQTCTHPSGSQSTYRTSQS